MTANRFLWRWNARLLRREWTIQVAILAIVAAATAVSVGGVLAVYNLTPPPERAYGNGQVQASITGDPSLARTALDDQGHPFGEITSTAVSLTGVARTIEIRVQDPRDPVAEPLLDLLEGRWPSGSDEIAATDGALRLLNADLGAEVVIAGNEVAIVGLVENPTRFEDEFVHAQAMDPFDVDQERVSTRFLVDAPPLDVVFPAGVGSISVQSGGGEIRNLATVAVDVAAAVAMLEVVLLAGTGFAIVARRRARQYGLLGAVGAPPRYLRRIAAMNGLATGVAAAFAGTIVGVAGAAAVVPRLESSVGHRIDLAAPWSALVPVVVLAVAAAGLAAWWPSRLLTRQSIVASLAAYRPQIRPVTRTATIGAVAALAGTAALVAGSVRVSVGLAITGIVVALLGLLLLSPAAVKIIGRGAGRLPLTARLAARALARQQARSAAVVSALVLALGIPSGLAVTTAAIDDYQRRSEDNLADNVAILWLPGTEDATDAIPADLDASAVAGSLDRVAAAVPGARIVPIELAVDPDQSTSPATFDRLGLRPAVLPNIGLRPATEPCNCDIVAFGDRDEDGAELLFSPVDAWIASPALLDALQIDVPDPDRAGLGVSRWDDAVLSSHRQPGDDPDAQLQTSSTLPPYTSIADVLIWPETVAANGLDRVTAGWLVVAGSPLTPVTIADLESAAGPDLLSEVFVEPSPQSGLRLLGLLVGGLVGLGILASVISLHVAESGPDLRILRAIGASPGAGRRMSSATGAILAASAAVIAVPVGYLPLVPLLTDRQLGIRFVVPWTALAAIIVVFPMLAAGIGWVGSLRSSTTVRSV